MLHFPGELAWRIFPTELSASRHLSCEVAFRLTRSDLRMLCCIFCIFFFNETHYGTWWGKLVSAVALKTDNQSFWIYFSLFFCTCALSLCILWWKVAPPGSLGQINAIKLLMIMLHL